MSRVLAWLALVGLVVAMGTGCDKPVDDGKQIPTGTVGIDVEARKHPQASCTDCDEPDVGDPAGPGGCVDDGDCGECRHCIIATGACSSVGHNGDACTADSNECTDDICASGSCTHPAVTAGTLCSDSTPYNCSKAACSGTTCSQNYDVWRDSRPCGPSGTSPASATTCSGADYCDASGVCNPNHLGVGPVAGCNTAATECSGQDGCDGLGACVPNHILAVSRTACGDGVCNECNGSGSCGASAAGSGPGCNTGVEACSAADTCGAGTGTCNFGHVTAGMQVTGCNGTCMACSGSGTCTGQTGVAPTLGCTDTNPTDCYNAACISGVCTQAPSGSASYLKTTGTTCNPTGTSGSAANCYTCETTGTASSTCTGRTGAAPLLGCTDTNPTDCYAAACIAGTCTQQPTGTTTYLRPTDTACNPTGTSGSAAPCYSCQANSTTSTCTARSGAAPLLGCTDTLPTDCRPAACVAGTCSQAPSGSYIAQNTGCNQNGTSTAAACYECNATGSCNAVADNTQGFGCATTCNSCNGAGACIGRTGLAPLLGCTDSTPTNCYNTGCSAGTCSTTYQGKSAGTGCNPTGTSGSTDDCYQCGAGNSCVATASATQGPGCTGVCEECNGSGTCIATPSGQLRAGCVADSNDCTDDYCNGSRVCAHPNDDQNTCGDNVCEFCASGTCTNVATQTQGVGCASSCRECNGAGGCVDTPNQVLRSGCTADANPCTDDYCNGAGSCTHPSNDANTCGDGICEYCASGTCTQVANNTQATGCNATCQVCDGAGACGAIQNGSLGGGCASDGNACTDDFCDGSTGGAACKHVNNDNNTCGTCKLCSAGACNNVGSGQAGNGCQQTCRQCNGAGACDFTGSGSGGPGCNGALTECSGADTCNGSGVCNTNHVQSGVGCGDGVCNECNGFGQCIPTPDEDQGPGCTDAATECSDADTCDGAGACEKNHKLTSVACGDLICNNCDGAGSCASSAAGVAGPSCNGTPSECSAADTCDALGSCNFNHVQNGTSCGTGICEECSGGGCVKTTVGLQGPGCDAVSTECSDADTCDNGVCKQNHKLPGTACGDSSPGDCNVAECNGAGVCVQAHRVLANGLGCGDGVCNQCSDGACVATGNGLSGPGCDAAGTECSDAGSCDGNGACQGNPKPLGTDCTDTTPTDCKVAKCNGSGACNQSATDRTDGQACGDGICNECQTGVCIDTPSGVSHVNCAADLNSCTHDYCSGVGTCVHPPKTGTACDDGNACTYADQCTNTSTCAGTSVTCTSDVCGTRTCNGTSVCTLIAHNDVDCDADDDKCTPKDKCQGGVCVKDDEVECVQQDCYTEAVCNKTTGECESTPLSDVPCGLTGCFEAGTCDNGKCSGTAVDCAFLSLGCQQGVCDTNAPGEGQDKCRQQKRPNGSSCDGENLCLIDAVCVAGECEGDVKPCTTTVTCRVASCEPTTGECVEQFATPGTACALSNDCLENTSCNASGDCRGTLLPDEAPCGTAADCPGAGMCMSGACICNTETVDLAMSQDLTQGPVVTEMPDLSGPGGADPPKCACQAGPASIPESVLFFLIVGLGLRRRRQ